jgi:hypothetical protein
MSRTATLALLATLAGCGLGSADEFSEAMPTLNQLSISIPEGTIQTKPGQLTQSLTGQPPVLYGLSSAISKKINTKILIGLIFLGDIVRSSLPSIQGDQATWGPYTTALDPLSWKLQARRLGPGQFSYELSAKRKTDITGTFKTILTGTSRKGSSSVFSGYAGSFEVTSSALNTLAPLLHPEKGMVVATYDTTGSQRRIEMELKGYSVAGGQPYDGTYTYLERADRSGEFRFDALWDLQRNGSTEEKLSVLTAWNSQGAGRGDASITGGDLPQGEPITMTECWDASLGLLYYQDSLNIRPVEGEEASCAFAGLSR